MPNTKSTVSTVTMGGSTFNQVHKCVATAHPSFDGCESAYSFSLARCDIQIASALVHWFDGLTVAHACSLALMLHRYWSIIMIGNGNDEIMVTKEWFIGHGESLLCQASTHCCQRSLSPSLECDPVRGQQFWLSTSSSGPDCERNDDGPVQAPLHWIPTMDALNNF